MVANLTIFRHVGFIKSNFQFLDCSTTVFVISTKITEKYMYIFQNYFALYGGEVYIS